MVDPLRLVGARFRIIGKGQKVPRASPVSHYQSGFSAQCTTIEGMAEWQLAAIFIHLLEPAVLLFVDAHAVSMERGDYPQLPLAVTVEV